MSTTKELKPQTKSRKRVRRPGHIINQGSIQTAMFERTGDAKGKPFVHLADEYLTAKECRRLGAWLLKSADYLDSKATRPRRK